MTHTFTTLMRRLSQAGFKNEFLRPAILPDWWDEAYAKDSDLLPEIEIWVARFLGLPLSTIRDSGTALAAPSYSGAQLRPAAPTRPCPSRAHSLDDLPSTRLALSRLSSLSLSFHHADPIKNFGFIL